MLINHKGQLLQSDPGSDDTPSTRSMIALADLLDLEGALSAAEDADTLLVSPEDRIEDAIPLLPTLDRVVFHFPKFSDGRPYSAARLVRSR